MRRLSLLLLLAVAPAAGAVGPPDPTARAIRRGLERLREGSANYLTNRQCFSCHHQAVTIAAFVAARKKGFAVPAAGYDKQVQFTLDTFRPKLAQVTKGQSVGGSNTTVAYALYTLELASRRRDATTDALVDFLVVRQRPDGSWPATTLRPPTEGSKFTNAALALRALRVYGPAEKGARRDKVEAAVEKGKAWLLKNEPETTEDRAFHLRALVTAGAAEKDIKRSRKALEEEQLDDGSWAQLEGRDGDAYATATVMLALKCAGLPATGAVYRRGMAYLVRTQSARGAWLVTTRSRPVQTFFDNKDPGGKNQFISFAATGWATLALVEGASVR
jgi:N-acyl-D-amino-acid deacylase